VKRPTARSIAKEQRRLITDLAAAVNATIAVPAEPLVIFNALCQAMSERRAGRPVTLTVRPFPKTMANTTGLWIELTDQDIIVVEENLDDDHKLVVLGHELWHMEAGHCGHDVEGAAVAARAALSDEINWPELARVAARSHSHEEDEVAAEQFGLLLGSRMSPWLATPGTRQLDDVARRIGAALGYNGSQG
jgi:hypothetical protein